jgi:hypothetical protein
MTGGVLILQEFVGGLLIGFYLDLHKAGLLNKRFVYVNRIQNKIFNCYCRRFGDYFTHAPLAFKETFSRSYFTLVVIYNLFNHTTNNNFTIHRQQIYSFIQFYFKFFKCYTGKKVHIKVRTTKHYLKNSISFSLFCHVDNLTMFQRITF